MQEHGLVHWYIIPHLCLTQNALERAIGLNEACWGSRAAFTTPVPMQTARTSSPKPCRQLWGFENTRIILSEPLHKKETAGGFMQQQLGGNRNYSKLELILDPKKSSRLSCVTAACLSNRSPCSCLLQALILTSVHEICSHTKKSSRLYLEKKIDTICPSSFRSSQQESLA